MVARAPRVVLLRGYRGGAEEFIWGGIHWTITQVLDRSRDQTIVVIQPAARTHPDARSETPLRDFGAAAEYGIGVQGPSMHAPLPTLDGAGETTPREQQRGERQRTTPTYTTLTPEQTLRAYGRESMAPGAPDQAITAVTPELIQSLTLDCLNGDDSACQQIYMLQAVRPDLFGTAGTDDAMAIAEMQESGAMERLKLQLQTEAQGQAEAAAQAMRENLMAALSAIGFSAPEIFAGIRDPAELRDALLAALQSGEVYPTLERQQLIAEAAQNPSDVVRLLFLAGGRQQAPINRRGSFNVFGVAEEGRRALEGLARQIAGTPRVTFDELLARFMPPFPASKGAIITMRKGDDGVYHAASGATITEGPEIFTVGEKGTEFALLAPGSVVAPKASKGEPETRTNALKAIREVALYGRRLPTKGRLKAAQYGTSVFGDLGELQESELRPSIIERLLEGAQALGAAMEKPERSVTERARDLRLRLFGFATPGQVSGQERRLAFAQLPVNVQMLLSTSAMRDIRYREALWRYASALAQQGGERGLEGEALLEFISRRLGRTSMPARPTREEIFAESRRTHQLGGEGTGLSIPMLAEMPQDVRAATLTLLGSLVGSDVVAGLVDLLSRGQQQAFAAGESRLAATR